MPATAVRRFSDPEEYQQSIRAADVRLWPTSKGRFNAELIQLTFDRVWAQKAQEALPRIYEGKVLQGRVVIGFLTDPNQLAIKHCGRPVQPGVIIVNDASEMHRQTASECRWGSLSLAHEDFLLASRNLLGRELDIPHTSYLVRSRPELMASLLSLHHKTATLAKVSPQVLEKPEVGRGIEDQFIRLMVLCLSGGEFLPMSVGQRRHCEIMASFECFLEQRVSEPVYLAEICAATGASERTLRFCCQEHLGMSPIHYLWLRRMYLARKALKRAAAETTTVTKVATDNGFWELGRFAKEYSALFGETPSATLRRKPLQI